MSTVTSFTIARCNTTGYCLLAAINLRRELKVDVAVLIEGKSLRIGVHGVERVCRWVVEMLNK